MTTENERQRGPESAAAEEDRILRVWTPVLLRTVLAASMATLVTGFVLMAVKAPAHYVERYRLVKAGQMRQSENVIELAHKLVHGDPYALLTAGLFLLTLVPLARVIFCFLLFVRTRDRAYVLFTAYVLLGLVAGVLLGRV